MNADSPVFVPQAAAVAAIESPKSPYGSPPLTPTGSSNMLQWPHFARNMPNMHFYHQQHLRQQQLRHIFQQQRNFFNPNFNYQWAQMSIAAAAPPLPQPQQQQQLHHKRCQTPKRQQQQQQQQPQQQRQKQKETTKQQQQQQKPQPATKKTTTTKSADTVDSVDSIVDDEPPQLSNAKTSQLASKPEVPTKKYDTMQPNGSRASHSMKAHQHHHQHQLHHNQAHNHHHQHHHHHQQQQQQPQHLHLNTKHDSSDSGVSTNGQQQRHQHQHQHQQQQQQLSHAKQRKSRSNSKRQDGATAPNIDAKQRTSNFTVDDWLDRDMVYCYERRYISSCAEDNMPRHNPIHRNSTSSDAAASDDLNSSSSNEDLSAAFAVISKSSKKSGKARQKRQQKRKTQEARNARIALGPGPEPMDVDDDSAKENQRPASNGVVLHVAPHKNANANLRKQCTKAAAFKAAAGKHIAHNNSSSNIDISITSSSSNNNNQSSINALSNSPSNSSVCSTLSSASSTLSLSSSSSVASSASNSPTNSANCSPTASPTASKRVAAADYKKIARTVASPLRQHAKLNMTESELALQLRRYVIDPNLLRVYGFPVESAVHEGCIEIYKCLPKPYHHAVSTHIASKSGLINTVDGLTVSYAATSIEQQWTLVDDGTGSGDSADSGQVSGDSSPPSVDSDSSEAGEDETATTTACYTPDGSYQIFSQYDQSLEKQCARCQRAFHVTASGEYLSRESCVFHWGKLYKVYAGVKGFVPRYTCCQRGESDEGCSRNPLHVWTGAVVGLNGPYADFVHTRPHRNGAATAAAAKVYALDCEMSFTGRGLEVTKVTVIGYDGQLVYEHFVRPAVEIVDYNTRFSGITEQDLCTDATRPVKTLPEVQRDLLQLIDADTILIGHALDNDLRVLRIVHKTIVDTSVTFPHVSGFPYRRSLKHLTKAHLHRDIQCGDAGHSSLEDSRACLELMLWKVRKDVRY